MNYGIPYKGSKNKIAESIIAQLPPAKHFYDLFGGGGAMTHCALLSGKYEFVHYNEFNPLVFKAFKMALNGEFKDENRWITREDFNRLKDTDPYVACCFSFGNDFKTYAYGKDTEKFKKAVHYSIFFDDNTLLNDYIDLKDFKYSSKNIKERRSELHSLLKNSKLKIEYGKPNQPISQHSIWLERLQELNNGGGVLLSNLSYEEVPIESDSVIYCDPPYKNTNTYIDVFSHEKFYEWLRDCRKHNQQIFISEYQMPNDFFEVYYKEKTILINAKTTTFKQEKLFSTLNYSPIELFEW
jgi:site-specific DNA-adenine methylase